MRLSCVHFIEVTRITRVRRIAMCYAIFGYHFIKCGPEQIAALPFVLDRWLHRTMRLIVSINDQPPSSMVQRAVCEHPLDIFSQRLL